MLFRSNEVIAEYKKSASLGDDTAYGVNDTNDLMGASPNVSLSPNNILNIVPADIKKSVKVDIAHNYSLPIKSDYALLFLESFSLGRTNDIKTTNSGIHTHQRAYVFTLITPNQSGEYTEFPGKMQLVYTVDNVENLNSLQPGYIYETILGRDDKNSLIKSNPTSGTSVNSKLLGESGAGVSAIEFPNTAFRKITTNGIKPDFTGIGGMANNDINKEVGITTPINKEIPVEEKPLEKAVKLESLIWFSGWEWKG